MPRMSVSMTLDAVKARTKTKTRRHVNTWKNLKPGDRLTLIEKGMGLPKGATQVVVCDVEVVDVRVEPLGFVNDDEVHREGLAAEATAAVRAGTNTSMADWFIEFWCHGHGYRNLSAEQQGDVECRVIEWRYLEEVGSDA